MRSVLLRIKFALLLTIWALGFVMPLSGCTNQAEQLEEKLTVAEKAGASPDDQCRIITQIADAWTSEGNVEKAKHWTMMRDLTCSHAEFCSSAVGGC